MGGVLGVRWGLSDAPSLTDFGAANIDIGSDVTEIDRFATDIGGVQCLLSKADPLAAHYAVAHFGEIAGAIVGRSSRPAVADLGRLHHGSPAESLAIQATMILVACRTTIDEVDRAGWLIQRLQRQGANVGLLVLGEAPNLPQEVADELGVTLLGAIPHDPLVGSGFAGGTCSSKRIERSLLWRSLSGIAEELLDLASRSVTIRAATTAPKQISSQPATTAKASVRPSPLSSPSVTPAPPKAKTAPRTKAVRQSKSGPPRLPDRKASPSIGQAGSLPSRGGRS